MEIYFKKTVSSAFYVEERCQIVYIMVTDQKLPPVIPDEEKHLTVERFNFQRVIRKIPFSLHW